MLSPYKMNSIITVGAMIVSGVSLLITLICLMDIFNDVMAGNLALASIKLVIALICAVIGVGLAFLIANRLR